MRDGGAKQRRRQRGRGGLWLVVVVVAVAALALLPFACEDEPAAPPETPKPVAEAPKPAAPRTRDGAVKPVEEASKEHDGSHVFRVVNVKDEPIAGARVWVRKPPGGVLRLPTTTPTFVTEKDGIVRLPAATDVRVLDIASKGRFSRRLRVPAGPQESAAPVDVRLAASVCAFYVNLNSMAPAEVALLRPRGVLWPRGTRPADGPPPGATDDELSALGAIIVPIDSRGALSFDGPYADDVCVDVIGTGRIAVPWGVRASSANSGLDIERSVEWPGGQFVSASLARLAVTDAATGKLVEGVVCEDASERAVSRPSRSFLSNAREGDVWESFSGLRDISDAWTLRSAPWDLPAVFDGLPPVAVRTLARFPGRGGKSEPGRMQVRIRAPGYDPVVERIEFAAPWSGNAIPVVQVKLSATASTEIVPFTFVDGQGAPLAGMFVDAPFAPTGLSVEGPGRERAPIRVRGFTDARGMISAPIAVGTWTPWRGKDHLPTWEVSDFGVRPGQAESARAMLAEALAKVVIVDPDGQPVRYSLPLLIAHEPLEQSLRASGQDGRIDGHREAFAASPDAPGTYVSLRAFHYGFRRFRPEGRFVGVEQGVAVEVPFQQVGTVRLTTFE